MNSAMFRDLRADEIEVRVAQAKDTGVSLLLYKDARVDQNILDETVGPFNWMRHHSRDNANCTVSIWDAEKQLWVTKEDTGVESNTEKEKGLASDSFKRACFNWGIGRELYTAPFIWVKADDCKKLKEDRGRWKCNDSFTVKSITITDKRITGLEILNGTTGKIVYTLSAGRQEAPKQTAPQQEVPKKSSTPREQLIARLAELEISVHAYAKSKGLTANSTNEDYLRCLKELENA